MVQVNPSIEISTLPLPTRLGHGFQAAAESQDTATGPSQANQNNEDLLSKGGAQFERENISEIMELLEVSDSTSAFIINQKRGALRKNELVSASKTASTSSLPAGVNLPADSNVIASKTDPKLANVPADQSQEDGVIRLSPSAPVFIPSLDTAAAPQQSDGSSSSESSEEHGFSFPRTPDGKRSTTPPMFSSFGYIGGGSMPMIPSQQTSMHTQPFYSVSDEQFHEDSAVSWLTWQGNDDTFQREMAKLARPDGTMKQVSSDIDSNGGRGRRENDANRANFRKFYSEFKAKEREGRQQAEEYAMHAQKKLMSSAPWRVQLELADLAKRHDDLDRARALYASVRKENRGCYHGWLESAKMEEELGYLQKSAELLEEGLVACNDCDGLLLKAVKLEEKLGNLSKARSLLSRMREFGADRAWRVMLEGALVESRAGNLYSAKKVFNYLLRTVPWYGPIYLEATCLYERNGDLANAEKIVNKGLKEIARYGPLWFAAIRIVEKMAETDPHRAVQQVRRLVERALRKDGVSKELTWKILFEAAQVEARLGHVDSARQAAYSSLLLVPDNLRWKALLGLSRIETRAGRIDVVDQISHLAQKVAPSKMVGVVIVDRARSFEAIGDRNKASEVLRSARHSCGQDWKVWLESVLVELRQGNWHGARELAAEGVKRHPGTGRLWSLHIQTLTTDEERHAAFLQALEHVPKSGELWCEGGRLALNPTSKYFDPEAAAQRLSFAANFTPQYGDTFIEIARCDVLRQGAEAADGAVRACTNAEPNYGAIWFACKQAPGSQASEVIRHAIDCMRTEMYMHRRVYQTALLRVAKVVSSQYSNPSLPAFEPCFGAAIPVLRSFTQEEWMDMSSADRIKWSFGPDHVHV